MKHITFNYFNEIRDMQPFYNAIAVPGRVSMVEYAL